MIEESQSPTQSEYEALRACPYEWGHVPATLPLALLRALLRQRLVEFAELRQVDADDDGLIHVEPPKLRWRRVVPGRPPIDSVYERRLDFEGLRAARRRRNRWLVLTP